MPDTVLLRASGINKWFGATHALRNAAVEVRAGEIHALVGANGSGKSTLVKVITGAISAEHGTVELPLPGTAMGAIHQNLGLIIDASVRENICAVMPAKLLSPAKERAAVQGILDRLGVDIPAHATMRELPIDQQAFVAVARALAEMGDAASAVLVVDEVTSVLRGQSATAFGNVLRRLRERGIGILLVSHDLDEVLDLADRVTVIVDGAIRAVESAAGLHRDALTELMTGSAVIAASEVHAIDSAADSAVVLDVRGLGGDLLEHLDLTVRAGEVVGLIGVPGSGYEEAPYLLVGAPGYTRRGEVRLGGTPVDSPASFARAGGAIIPADRNRTALIAGANVLDNFMANRRGGFDASVFRNFAAETRRVAAALRDFGIKAQGPRALINSLSGGNQQKLILARSFEAKPGLLVVHEPTQGVDVRARADLLAHIHRATEQRGLAVLYVCGDINEVWDNVHRVVVLRRGRQIAAVSTLTDSKDSVHHYLY
jgi:ABC-type sugar transport system ATPase subunit